jgi:hypothetical protein
MSYDQWAETPPRLRSLRPDEYGRVFDRNGGQLWPEVDGCTCMAAAAEYDPLSLWLYITYAPAAGCPVHPGKAAV